MASDPARPTTNLLSPCAGGTLWNFNPLPGDHRNVRRDDPGAPTGEDEDDLLRHVAHGNAEELGRPLAEHHVGPHAAPVVMLPGPLGLPGERDERVGPDLSRVGQLLQPGRVRRRRHRADEHFDPLSFHHRHIVSRSGVGAGSQSLAWPRAAPPGQEAPTPCLTLRRAARRPAARRAGRRGPTPRACGRS